jgi:hypothetical protein
MAKNYIQKCISVKLSSNTLCADFSVLRIMYNLKATFRELQIFKWICIYNVILRANKNTECLLTLTLWRHPRTGTPINVSRKRKREGNRNYICWRSYKYFVGSAVLSTKGVSYIEILAGSSRPCDTSRNMQFWSQRCGWLETTWLIKQGNETCHLTAWHTVL